MKTLPRFLATGLVLISSAIAGTAVSAPAWLESYYLNPEPANLAAEVQRLSESGFLDRSENTAVAIGFLGALFARHPERVEGWLAETGGLPARHRRILAAALWQSGHAAGPALLRTMADQSPVRAEIERLATLPPPVIAETSVVSVSSLRLHWGAFLATGDERHIVSILDAFGRNEPALTSAARLALARHAAVHPRVLAICRAQLDRQPEEIRSELRAALHAAADLNRS
jgi:hypothetical protein